MGLDMYLEGRTFNWKMGGKVEKRDGFRVKGVMLELGYWRKHPDLHGYIVQKFANGEDRCQEIPLDEDALRNILAAVKADALPHTEGFFFGQSQSEDKKRSIEILEGAIKWLEQETPPRREVVYQASW